MGTKCQPCEKSKWKAEIGVMSCRRCEASLMGSITLKAGSTIKASCVCPERSYDDGQGKCVPVEEGMRSDLPGMKLESAELEPGYWRTGPSSRDVRECITPEACIGGNGTDVCRDGHKGPYCNLCLEGFTKDPFQICRKCEATAIDALLTCLAILGVIIFLGGARYILKKKFGGSEKGSMVWKKLKNGFKVMFASGQITASLPRVIPAVSLPSSYHGVVRACQFLNLDVFTFVPFGCWAGGFNFYYQNLAMTLPVCTVCLSLWSLGMIWRSQRQSFHTVAIAITYLVLPTITTTIFGLLSCDNFDDGENRLRRDYLISCDDKDRTFWVVYAYLMIAIFPVGVTGLYFFLLYRKRDCLKKKVEERAEDGGIQGIVFLWDPYKPSFWYFEVIETAR